MGRSIGSTLATKKCRQNQTCQRPCWKNGAAKKCPKPSVIHRKKKLLYDKLKIYIIYIYMHILSIDVSGWLLLLFSCWNMSCSHQVGRLLNYKFRSLSPRCHGWSIGDITKDAPMVQKCDIQKGWSGFREVGGLGLWLGGCRFCTLNQTSFPPDLVETSPQYLGRNPDDWYVTGSCAGENSPKMVGKGTNLQPRWGEHHVSREPRET